MPARPPVRLNQHDQDAGGGGPLATALPTLLSGLSLAAGVALLVWVDDLLDLQVGPVALVGVALGAVVALVPDRAAGERLGGFVAGAVLALGCYLVRAATLPDAAVGLAAAAVLTVLLCTAVALLSLDRLPLWTLLLGAGAFAGVYERTFTAAVAEAATTSLSTITALAATAASGFLLATLAPRPPVRPRRATPEVPAAPTDPVDPVGAHTQEVPR